MEDSFAFEAIEVFCEAAAVSFEVVALYGEHKEGVEFIEGIEDTEEVARVPVGGYREQIS